MTNRKIQYWVIPPQADVEFVANMEGVLETYAKPYDPLYPRGLYGRAARAIGQGDPHKVASELNRKAERLGSA